jgi:hypothetical protein
MAAVDAFSFADQRIRVELVPPEGASEEPRKNSVATGFGEGPS